MCGIAGGTLYDRDTIDAALRSIDHRGRDATAAVHYEGDGVWMGHNRLAIQDLSSGANQPIEVGDTSLVFNGELWRRSMDANPEYASDTKLLVDSYDGSDPVAWARGLDGMFALAVYDAGRGQVVLARDWVGRVPLYYVVDAGALAFASEAKAIAGPLGRRFAGNNTRAQSKSEVKLFPPGHVGVYDLHGGTMTMTPFCGWDQYRVGLDELDGGDRGADYYAEGIRQRLEAAVVNELIADVPVCTILSGGVDSTIITAILARHVPDLKAYTVSVGDSDGKDDLASARKVAAALGVPLNEVIVSVGEVSDGLVDTVWAVEDDRWVQVAPAVPQIAMARRIGGDGYKVVFGGEGADELFASYGDVRRWSWEPEQYHLKRVRLCETLHDNNLIRGNKAMMWGGTVELRTPFLDRDLVDFCLRIPTRYRSSDGGKGAVMKPLLREAFRGVVPDELLMRKKVAFQEGCHSDFLKGHKDVISCVMRELFSAT